MSDNDFAKKDDPTNSTDSTAPESADAATAATDTAPSTVDSATAATSPLDAPAADAPAAPGAAEATASSDSSPTASTGSDVSATDSSASEPLIDNKPLADASTVETPKQDGIVTQLPTASDAASPAEAAPEQDPATLSSPSTGADSSSESGEVASPLDATPSTTSFAGTVDTAGTDAPAPEHQNDGSIGDALADLAGAHPEVIGSSPTDSAASAGTASSASAASANEGAADPLDTTASSAPSEPSATASTTSESSPTSTGDVASPSAPAADATTAGSADPAATPSTASTPVDSAAADAERAHPDNAPDANVPHAENQSPDEHPRPAEDPTRINPVDGTILPDEKQPDGASASSDKVVGTPALESASDTLPSLQHPAPAENPTRVDPLTGEALPAEKQPDGVDTSSTTSSSSSSADADEPAPVLAIGEGEDDDELAQDDANEYEEPSYLRPELEKLLHHVRSALKHEAELAKKLMHEIEGHVKGLLGKLKAED